MDARPVRQQMVPRYPTRMEALADRELLEKHMPPAWKSCVEMAGAVTMLLAANNCFAQQPGPKGSQLNKFVAPIFEHGKGRSAIGCSVINPPVFLSEQDAMQVILEEMKKAGLTRRDDTTDLPDTSVPQTIQRDGSKPIIFEGSNAKKKIGFSVVVEENYFYLGGERSHSTVQEFNYIDLAKKNRDYESQNNRNIYFGTFYDPAAKGEFKSDRKYIKEIDALKKKQKKTADLVWKDRMEDEINNLYRKWSTHEFSKKKAQRLLRMQVRDFIDWLKGQGVI